METGGQRFSFIIRPVESRDARDINIMRRLPEVVKNTLSLPSESISQNEDFIANLTAQDHIFCAETNVTENMQVIALGGLQVKKPPRERHCAILGLIVHSDFHGKGVGQRLMESLMDLADNWLLLKRVDLTVYPDNHAAIKLYEKFGFVVEGTMKYASLRQGKYADILMMGRYKNKN